MTSSSPCLCWEYSSLANSFIKILFPYGFCFIFFFCLNHEVLWGESNCERHFKLAPQLRLKISARTGRHMFSQQIRLPCNSNWRANLIKPLKETSLPVEPTLCWWFLLYIFTHTLQSKILSDRCVHFDKILLISEQ